MIKYLRHSVSVIAFLLAAYSTDRFCGYKIFHSGHQKLQFFGWMLVFWNHQSDCINQSHYKKLVFFIVYGKVFWLGTKIESLLSSVAFRISYAVQSDWWYILVLCRWITAIFLSNKWNSLNRQEQVRHELLLLQAAICDEVDERNVVLNFFKDLQRDNIFIRKRPVVFRK